MDKGNDCLVSVDGTDFQVPQRDKEFYSFKFRKSALRYKVALCILTGDIVWINCPFPAGKYNDIKIFRNSLIGHLDQGERVEADDGYVGEHPKYVKCPMGNANLLETEPMQSNVRHRHETVNKRFKNWGILKQVFRNDLRKHRIVFSAIAVITQIAIEMGDPLFKVRYRDPPYN